MHGQLFSHGRLPWHVYEKLLDKYFRIVIGSLRCTLLYTNIVCQQPYIYLSD